MRVQRCEPLLGLLLLGCAVPVQHEGQPSRDGTTRRGILIDGNQEGEWVADYPSGQIAWRGHYKNDKRHGHWTSFHPNGKPSLAGTYDRGLRSGFWQYWWPNGRIRAQGCLQDSVEIGEWQCFDRDGKLIRRWDRHGPHCALHSTEFDADGRAKAAGYYVNGVKCGPWTYCSGAEAAKTTKTYAVADGLRLVREAWEGGAVQREGFVRADTPVGRWATRHPNGRRRLTGDYVAGKPAGIWCAYRVDGRLLAMGPVEAGRMVGSWRAWPAGSEAGEVLLDETRPQEIWSGEWSRGGDERDDPMWLVATWLTEAMSPLRPQEPEVVPEANPAPAAARVETETPARDADMPLPPSVSTVKEVRIRDDYRRDLERGRSSSARAYPGGKMRPQRRGDVKKAETLIDKACPLLRLPRAEGGEDYDLRELSDRKTLVVILHGFGSRVCDYCIEQVRAMAKLEASFRERETDVLLVYPGDKPRLDEFRKEFERAVQGKYRGTPFPILYDPDLRLVDELGVRWHRGMLARPTTLLVGPTRRIHYAHVSKPRSLVDRPAVPSLLEAIDDLNDL